MAASSSQKPFASSDNASGKRGSWEGDVDESASLATLGKKPKPEAKKRNTEAAEDADEAAALATLGKKAKLQERRPRIDTNPPLLQDAILGFLISEDDPTQAGEVKPRQSEEISSLSKKHGHGNVPIAKEIRHGFVWCAKAKSGADARPRFTLNADEMEQVQNYEDKSQNTCDVCGASCTEVLYQFRCYERSKDPRPDRRLHPFISYISRKCGAGLLGVQSDLSKLRELVYKIVQGEDATTQLASICMDANDMGRRVIQNELQLLAGIQSGERLGADIELRKAQAQASWGLGRLTSAVDPFRALARALTPAVNARMLASVAAVLMESCHELRSAGYMEAVVQSLHQQLPLPPPPTAWEADDLAESLQMICNAWPIRMECFDLLEGRKEFAPPGGYVLQTMKVVFLRGSQTLHANDVRLERKDQEMIKEYRREELREGMMRFGGVAVKMSTGPTKTQDRSIVVPDVVGMEYVENVLRELEWPDCTSRANVRPEGVTSIQAMCLGAVKPFFANITVSRYSRLLPNVCKLLTRFAAQCLPPEYRYTSIQLNKNYSAKVHVDKNNHGPSWIIGLGDYQDGSGQLWVYDESGSTPMRVDHKLRGYPHLQPGTTVMGNLFSIKNRWLQFDGTIPHCAMPFKGNTRISIVYFTRKLCLDVRREAKALLDEYGFPYPDAKWLEDNQPAPPPSMLAAKRQRLPSSPEQAGSSEEEEVDEDESMHASADQMEGYVGPQLRATHFAKSFREALGVQWQEHVKLRVGLTCCCAGAGPAAALALQELLPTCDIQVLCVAEDAANDVAIKVARQNVKPLTAFKNLLSFVDGRGHCEVQHKDGVELPVLGEVLHFGTFWSAPFLNRDGSRATCKTDPKAQRLRAIRSHVASRRPPMVLLEVPDWYSVPLKQQRGVLEFVLDEGQTWGLRTVPNYHLELFEVQPRDYGLPVEGTRLHIVMARKDYASMESLSMVADLSPWLGSLLPKTTAHELTLPDDDPRLQAAQRKRLKQMPSKPADWAEGRYTMHLRQLQLQDTVWFATADKRQQKALNIVWQQVEDAGDEPASVFLDLVQTTKDRPWRGDGILPGPCSGAHYSFLRHRRLCGHEELLCRGYQRLNADGITDEELRTVALQSPCMLTVAGTVASMLACIDLKLPRQRTLAVPVERLQALCKAIGPKKARLSAGNLNAEVEKVSEEDAAEDATTGKAVALLNLLTNGRLLQAATDEDGVQRPASEDVQKARHVLQNVVKTSAPEDLPLEVVPMKQAQSLESSEAGSKETREPRLWADRLRKLHSWYHQRVPVPLEWALRWVADAASDIGADSAREIVDKGTEHILRCVRPELVPKDKKIYVDTSLRGLDEHLDTLVDVLNGSGFGEQARKIDKCGFSALFRHDLKASKKDVMLDGGRNMEDYVHGILRRLDWPGRREFLNHMADLIKDRKWGRRHEIDQFNAAGGFDMIVECLQNIPETEADWVPKDRERLIRHLCALAPPTCRGLLCELYRTAQSLPPSEAGRSSREIAARMAVVIKEHIDNRVEVQNLLADFKNFPDSVVRRRFSATFDLLARMREVGRLVDNQFVESQASETLKISREHLMIAEMAWKQAHQDMSDGGWFKPTLTKPLPADIWGDLHKEESERLREARVKLDERIRVCQQREKEEARRDMEEHQRLKEFKLKEEMLEQAKKDREDRQRANAMISKSAANLRALIDHVSVATHIGRAQLRSPTVQGFGIFREAVKNYAKAYEEYVAVAENPDDNYRVLLEEAKNAADYYCQSKPRKTVARKRLHDIGLGHIEPVLHERNLLDRLANVDVLEALLAGLGLPPSAGYRVVQAARKGQFREEVLQPQVPHAKGYVLATSRDNGLQYLRFEADPSKSRWEWPDIEFVNKVIKEPSELVFPEPWQGDPSRAGYILADNGDTLHCALCEDHPAVNRHHLEDPAHRARKTQWQALASNLERFQRDSEDAVSAIATESVSPGVLTAWKIELLQALKESSPSPPLLQAFWHLVVREVWSSVTSGQDLSDAFTTMIASARLPEPAFAVELPQLGVDFLLLPEPNDVTSAISKSSPEEAIELLTPEDLLREGVVVVEGTSLWCECCEVKLGHESLLKHIHPHYQEGQRHKRNKDILQASAQLVMQEGWRFEHEGLRLQNKEFACKCDGKVGQPYYMLADHLITNKHKTHSAKIPQVAEEKQTQWRSAMSEAREEYLRRLEEQQEAKGEAIMQKINKKLAPPQPTVPLQRPMPAVKARLDASRIYYQPTAEEEQKDEEVEEEAQESGDNAPAGYVAPPLAIPGKDFPVLDESSTGIVRKSLADKPFCMFCSMEVNSTVEEHVATKRHRQFKQVGVEISQKLQKSGHLLFLQGVRLEDEQFVCSVCDKRDSWWEVYNHIDMKKHQKALSYDTTLPKDAYENAEREAAWRKACQDALEEAKAKARPAPKPAPAKVVQPKPASPRATPTRAASSDPPALPPGKVARIASPKPAPASSSSASSSTAPPWRAQEDVAVETTELAKGCPAPSTDDITRAAEAAKNRYAPDLTKPLCWGYFDGGSKKNKKKDLYIWCAECQIYPSIVRFNIQEGLKYITPDGSCAHFTSCTRAAYQAAMDRLMKSHGW